MGWLYTSSQMSKVDFGHFHFGEPALGHRAYDERANRQSINIIFIFILLICPLLI